MDLYLGFSTVAIVVTIAVSFAISLVPFGLAYLKLSGKMVTACNNSRVMAAACHVIRKSNYERNDCYDGLLDDDMATMKLRWGVVKYPEGDEPGRLAFGTEGQVLGDPVVGQVYR